MSNQIETVTESPSDVVRGLYDATLQTVEGHKYPWSLGTSVNNAAVVPKYS